MADSVLSVREGQVLILEFSQRSGAVIFPDLESHLHAQKCADESLKGTGVTAVVLPACVRVVGVK